MSPNTIALLPELVLTLVGVLIMLIEPVLGPRSSRRPLGWLAILGTLAAGIATAVQSHYVGHHSVLSAFSGTLEISTFSVFFHLLITAVVLVTLLTSLDYFPSRTPITGTEDQPKATGHAGEYFALVLFAATGMMLMTSAVELLVVFIGLEISSIASYIMCGFRRGKATATESSIKYFLLGSFATAFFLYGIALAFGATGSTTIGTIAQGLATTQTPRLAFLAVALILIGLGFKVSAAPFHVWTPDVYQGAPAPVVGLMSTAPKAAAFAVLLRILFVGFPAFQARWSVLLWILAALSMCVGNLGALLQRDVKRMLAYSSIAHAGYLLVAFTALPHDGIAAAMFYTAAYSAMNVGAFAVISAVSGYQEPTRSLDDFTGLALRRPVLAGVFAFFLLSLIGIPFTGGFFGKFYVFSSALRSGNVWLAVIGLLNSGFACFYYLRLLAALYTRPQAESDVVHPYSASLIPATSPEEHDPQVSVISSEGVGRLSGEAPASIPAPVSRSYQPPASHPVTVPAALGLGLAALATLILGVLPGHALHLANYGATNALNDTQHPTPETATTAPPNAER